MSSAPWKKNIAEGDVLAAVDENIDARVEHQEDSWDYWDDFTPWK